MYSYDDAPVFLSENALNDTLFIYCDKHVYCRLHKGSSCPIV